MSLFYRDPVLPGPALREITGEVAGGREGLMKSPARPCRVQQWERRGCLCSIAIRASWLSAAKIVVPFGGPARDTPFPFARRFQNGPRRQGFASPPNNSASLTAAAVLKSPLSKSEKLKTEKDQTAANLALLFSATEILATVKCVPNRTDNCATSAQHRCQVVTITNIWIRTPVAVINRISSSTHWQSERPKEFR